MNSSFESKLESSVVRGHTAVKVVEERFARAIKQAKFNFVLLIELLIGPALFRFAFMKGVTLGSQCILVICAILVYGAMIEIIKFWDEDYPRTPLWWQITREKFYSGILTDINNAAMILKIEPGGIYDMPTREFRTRGEEYLLARAVEMAKKEKAIPKEIEARTFALNELALQSSSLDSNLSHFLRTGILAGRNQQGEKIALGTGRGQVRDIRKIMGLWRRLLTRAEFKIGAPRTPEGGRGAFLHHFYTKVSTTPLVHRSHARRGAGRTLHGEQR
jgi:hypothetical protein